MSLADHPDVIQTLKNLIAHEMAHQFDGTVQDDASGFLSYDGQVEHRDFAPAYQNFHRCLKESGTAELGDAKKVISDYRTRASQSTSEDERARFAFQSELLETKMSRVVRRLKGAEPSLLDTHQEEIDADYWSFSELGLSVSDLPEEPARTRVKQSLSYLCSTPDDGFRPSGQFRIRMAFQNRLIAARTGYMPKPSAPAPGREAGKVATCAMSGEVEIIGPRPGSRKIKPPKREGAPAETDGSRTRDNGAAN